MDVVLVASVGVFLASVVFFIMSYRIKGAPKEVVAASDPAMVARMEAVEHRFEQLRGEYLDTLERANQQFARARATEAAIDRKRGLADGEEEPENLGQLSLLDGDGSDGQGVPSVHPDLEGLPPHLLYAKTVARKLISGT